MRDGNKKKFANAGKMRALIAKVLLFAMTCTGVLYMTENIGYDTDWGSAFAAESTESTMNGQTAIIAEKLQNGSFEDIPSDLSWSSGVYSQPDQSKVPCWNTTAKEGKIELFKSNKNTYIGGVTLTPTDGIIAAELNADEESTLYQVVTTTPSSIYEWGLDHGARNGKDIMALVIGPNQTVAPSKPNKAGRDHFMQMVDWLKDNNAEIANVNAGDEPKQYTVYSKKFAASGTFEDNAGNNAFSLTPSTIYTEEWHIWIMASVSAKTTNETVNPWNSYGSNKNEDSAKSEPKSQTGSSTSNEDLNKYYHYTVPTGQTKTLFGFVSVGYEDSPTTGDKAKTYGNFLDNINFEIYHPLSGSTSTHGSALVGGSDGTTEGTGSKDGHSVTAGKGLTIYVTDGEPLKIQAIITKADADDGCEFVGLYRTQQGENGDPVTSFLKLAGNEIDYSDSLTDEQKKGKWIKSTNDSGDIIYTYYLDDISSATDLHFVFIKSPTITYDPNGGKPYVVDRLYNTDEAQNVYSFKPASGHNEAQAGTETIFIDPYVSKEAVGQNSGWKFMGWLLTGDTVDDASGYTQVNAGKLGGLLLSAQHTIACDYAFAGVNGDTKAQYFKIYNGKVSLTKNIIKDANEAVTSVEWTDNREEIIYANVHKGLTLIAQWRWQQAFIPQVNRDSNYIPSADGGKVEIIGVDTTSDNYNADYNSNGGIAYFAETDETITVKATAASGYTFEGWYDAAGNLITTNNTYTYTETKEGVNTYYARFSNNCTQTFIRQVWNGTDWVDTVDNSIGTLGRYEYIDAIGSPVSSTASEGANYKFVGWYDPDGNKVEDSMLINNGVTIRYNTTGDATYIARFQRAYFVKFQAQLKQSDGTFKDSTTGGSVSASSGKGVPGDKASSQATAKQGYKFLGWYDKDGKKLTSDVTYTPTITDTTPAITYYARFERVYTVSGAYLSFIAENASTNIPDAFNGRDAGTGKNTSVYGNKYGNTISTGFRYSIDDMTNVNTIQVTVTIPAGSYVKVGEKNSLMKGDGKAILTDSDAVLYNKGSIQKIKGAATIKYYWNVADLQSGKTYGFIIDNLYAPNATISITINGTSGTQVTATNGVVNATLAQYQAGTHYPK